MRMLWRWGILVVGALLLAGCLPANPGLKAVIRTDPHPARGPYPLEVLFDGSSSQGPVEEWVWTVFRADGEAPLRVLSGPRVRYSFSERGRFRVHLEVRAGSAFDQTAVEVEVRSKPPVAAFLLTPASIQEGQLVQCDAGNSRDEDGQVVRYFWDFGDETWEETSGPMITHRYRKAGVYHVRLVVEDDSGDLSEPNTQRITVYPKGCGSCP